MSVINRQPAGWLGFLGIKNFGRNPTTAGDVISPTWDLQDLYLRNAARWVTTGALLNARGFFGTGQVPAGQIWKVWAYSYITNILAGGQSLIFQLAIQNTATGVPIPIWNTGSIFPISVGDQGTASLAEPMLLYPSETLGAYVTNFGAGNIACSVNYLYTVLDN